jgi:hypothetical protein
VAAPAALRRREAAAIVVVLLALASTAWLITDLRMAGMDAGPWTDPGPFGFYISAWVVLIIGALHQARATEGAVQTGDKGTNTTALASKPVWTTLNAPRSVTRAMTPMTER